MRHPGRRAKGVASRSPDGFTVIELLVVVTVIGLLAALAQPNLQRALLKARAAEAVADLNVIKVAVMSYLGENHRWPADVNRGKIPSGLAEYLPEDFSFVQEDYTIDYDDWSTKKNGFVGLTVITKDEALGQAMLDLLGSNTWTNGKDKFTWVIEWTD